MNRICFDRNLFIGMIIILVSVTSFFVYKKESESYSSDSCPACPPCPSPAITCPPCPKTPKLPKDPLLERDYATINDPLSPPTKRYSGYYSTSPFQGPFNIHTSGYPDNYQLVGYLKQKDGDKILQLFGRKKYPRGDKYEYYVKFKDPHQTDVKVNITKNNYQEIYSGDEIVVDFFGSDSADNTFVATINETDDYLFKYNPYII